MGCYCTVACDGIDRLAAILCRKYRVPSEPRSQAASGGVSTGVGDHFGTLCAAGFYIFYLIDRFLKTTLYGWHVFVSEVRSVAGFYIFYLIDRFLKTTLYGWHVFVFVSGVRSVVVWTCFYMWYVLVITCNTTIATH
jgi:hypothetical protein